VPFRAREDLGYDARPLLVLRALIHRSAWNKNSPKFGTLSLAWVASLSLATLPRAVLLVPAGVRLVKAADTLTLEVACPLQQPREHPRHSTHHPAQVGCFAS
jgi:hypothetical protein